MELPTSQGAGPVHVINFILPTRRISQSSGILGGLWDLLSQRGALPTGKQPGVAILSSRPRRDRRLEDIQMVRDLTRAHRELNATRFGGELSTIPIRVSGRMKSRLGHYTLRGQSRHQQEIVISRRHIRKHGWDEAVHTLLHEMVHQWQDETGRPVDHGPDFREKSRLVGITPRATRSVARPA